MDTVTLTIRFQRDEVDVVLPNYITLGVLVEILAEHFHWTELLEQKDSLIIRLDSSESILLPRNTLAEKGIVDGSILELVLSTKQ